VAFHTYNIIGMLMTDQQFKLGFAVRAVILVQWHRKLPPIGGKRFIIIDIVLRSSNIVKSEILISTHTSRSAEAKPPTGFGAAHLGDAITSSQTLFGSAEAKPFAEVRGAHLGNAMVTLPNTFLGEQRA
jgi:hypothetical protein